MTIRYHSREAFLASPVIPLDKNRGLRPIGIGEVKDDVIGAAGTLQLCVGQESDSETAILAIHDILKTVTLIQLF